VIVTDHQFPHVKTIIEELDERFGRILRQLLGELHEHHDVEVTLREILRALLGGRDEVRRSRRIDDLERMGLEGHQQTAAIRPSGPLRDLPEHTPVAQVDPIEGSDGHRRAAAVPGQRRVLRHR
jgi:hypothetical protein